MQTFHKVMSPHRLEDCVSNKAACLLNWRCCLLACWFKLRTLTLLPLRVSALSSIRPLAVLSLLIDRNLLVIVRTHGAQPATIHPTRSFAMMHAAIYYAVNAIDQTHEPYAVRRASRIVIRFTGGGCRCR